MLLTQALVRPLTRSLVRPALSQRGQDADPISATISPIVTTLNHGTSIENGVADWDDISTPSNYSSSEGVIVSVVIAYVGDAVDETTVLNAGDTAGFIITVTDSVGNEQIFDAGTVSVSAIAPGQVSGLVATAGDGQVSLVWAAPLSDGGSPITDYRIERNIAATGWTIVADAVGTGVSFVDTGRTNGVVHQYRVSAINSVGVGVASPTDSASPSGDVMPPVLSLTSWDNGTKTIGFTVSESCMLIACTHLGATAPAKDGSGGWSSTTIETFTQMVSGTGTFALTITNESAERISYYVRDAAGNDSDTLITETVTFAPSQPAALLDHAHFTQTTNLSGAGESETTLSAFSKAGTFLVGITANTTVYKTYTLSGPSVSAVSLVAERTAGNKNTGAHIYEVTTTAASDLIVTTDGAGNSYNRGIHIVEMNGLTAMGAITANNSTADQTGEDGSTVTLSAVPVGHHIFAIAISKQTNSTSVDWGQNPSSDFASGDVLNEQMINPHTRSTAASTVAGSTGDFVCIPSFVGADGSGSSSTIAVALDTV